MSDILKAFVEKEMQNQIKENYPHIQYPAGMYAQVTQVTGGGQGIFTCTLKILDKNLNPDNDIPEIPNVRTEIALEKDDIAVILMIYGGSQIWVLGRRT